MFLVLALCLTSFLARPDVEISKVGIGFSGRVYHVQSSDEAYILRYLDPDKPLSAAIQEVYFAQWAAERGIGPEVVAIDLDQRAMLLEVLDPADSHTGAVATFHQGLELIPFDTVRRFHRYCLDHQIAMPDVMAESVARVDEIQEAIGSSVGFVHGDLHSGNIIGGTLIDFEFAGIGDPFFDLVTLRTSEEELANLVGHPLTPRDRAHFYLSQQMMHLVVALNRLRKTPPSTDLPGDVAALNHAFVHNKYPELMPLRREPDADELCHAALGALQAFTRNVHSTKYTRALSLCRS